MPVLRLVSSVLCSRRGRLGFRPSDLLALVAKVTKMAFLVTDLAHMVGATQGGVVAGTTGPVAVTAGGMSANPEVFCVGYAKVGFLVEALWRYGEALLAAVLVVRTAAKVLGKYFTGRVVDPSRNHVSKGLSTEGAVLGSVAASLWALLCATRRWASRGSRRSGTSDNRRSSRGRGLDSNGDAFELRAEHVETLFSLD